MIDADPPARIAPLEPAEMPDDARAMFDAWAAGPFQGSDRNPVLQTFAHHPRLAAVFSPFNIHLLSTTTLPLRERQIAIMRTAWLCEARYMWSSHLRTSLRRGIEPELFDPIKAGADDPYFTDFERRVVLATDELVATRVLGDENWAALREHWNEQQMLDFLFTVGTYVMVAGVMRSVGMAREPELLELAARHGAPGEPASSA